MKYFTLLLIEAKKINKNIKTEENRIIVLKGEVYQCSDILVMATETTCSLTKSTFKGVFVIADGSRQTVTATIVGGSSKIWSVVSFENKK